MSQPDPTTVPPTARSTATPNATPLEARLRELEEQVRRLQEQEARRPRALLERMAGMMPTEARTHLRAAQRERLLAVRACVDAAIKRVEEQPADRRRRTESVRID